jgi:hypothetical protein
MALFHYGKSYLWLFLVYAGLFCGSFKLCDWVFGNFSLGFLTMPAFMVFLLGSEMRSGVALDSWWQARHLRGSWQYRAMLTWQAVAAVAMLAFSIVAIRSAP